MAYVFSNTLAPLLTQQQNQQPAMPFPQQPQTSSKSNFQDPNKLLSKNSGAQQGAVNTAVTGQAQQQFASNNAQLDKQTSDYQNQQKYQGQAVQDVAGDIQKGGNKLADILKTPQYQAQQFQPTVTNAIKPGGDYQGQLQNNIKSQRGQFYSQGESALDSALFKNTGAQAKAESQINQMSQQLGQRLNQVPGIQQAATAQGQAAQSQLQAQTRDQVNAYQQQLKQQDAADFFDKYKANNALAAQQAYGQAQARGSNVTQDQINQALQQQNFYKNIGGYISNNNLGQENTIANLLGQQVGPNAGTVEQYIDQDARTNYLNKLIESGIIAPPSNAPAVNGTVPQAPPMASPNDPTTTNSNGVTRNAQGQIVTPYSQTDEEYQQQFLGGPAINMGR